MAHKKNSKKGGNKKRNISKKLRQRLRKGGSASSYGLAAYGMDQRAMPPIAGNETNQIMVNPPMSGGSASAYGLAAYGMDQKAMPPIAGNETNQIMVNPPMSGGSAAAYGLAAFGMDQKAMPPIAGNETNQIMVNPPMNGGAPLGYGEYPMSNTTLLNPSQTGVVLAANNSAHSGTDAISRIVGGKNKKDTKKGAGILTDLAIPASLVIMNEFNKRRTKKRGGNQLQLDQMMDNNVKMQNNMMCQQNGPSAQLTNAGFGSSLTSASVNCNVSGGNGITEVAVPAVLLASYGLNNNRLRNKNKKNRGGSKKSRK